ncbi:hypothetical protein DUZ99_06880 [Xylanibacillus composti]|uniref:YugN-like protein n=1 Tax=Xylanibacillus composti TaxID=1572762 RepID=A0A8J4M434_9BACL|nr:YugN family protein [Xylanibacillus composti]MDT9724716.1 hypothetical protein [Xylanibacillus composti]GIQ70717.1 hypothetical protein XYCOK13_35410 [Xylanibacillus composti]
MIPLDSRLTGCTMSYEEASRALKKEQFVLGGNWDYDHGSFDRALDGVQKVWLRLPFSVTSGELAGDREEQRTEIRFDQPFLLNHEYREGLDPEADFMTYKGLVNQFQDPVDPDGELEPEWIEVGRHALKRVEALLL